MNDLERARELLLEKEYTCVLVKDDIIHTSSLTGIAPLLGFISAGLNLKGFSAADKIVGKAAAMLFAYVGIVSAYSPVMSSMAITALKRYNIKYTYDTLTDSIINREGTGSCPMENAVRNIDDPAAALQALKQTLESLRKKSAPPGKK